VAIKTVSRTILTPKLVDNLESEINILKQLKHPHITELIEIVKAERFIFLIMEDCTGGDLSGYLKRRGRIEGLQYIPEPGAALQYYPHPRTGGLDVVAVRSFLRQMGMQLYLDLRNNTYILQHAHSSFFVKGTSYIGTSSPRICYSSRPQKPITRKATPAVFHCSR